MALGRRGTDALVLIWVGMMVGLLVTITSMAIEVRGDGNDDVVCVSIPKNIQKQVPFIGNNPDTDEPSKCTQYWSCAWCDMGKGTNFKILGVKFNDFDMEGFCWYGNPFGLVNNSITVGSNPNLQSSLTVLCNAPPRWKQSIVPGFVALALFFGSVIGVILLSAICLGGGGVCTGIFVRKKKGSLRGYIRM